MRDRLYIGAAVFYTASAVVLVGWFDESLACLVIGAVLDVASRYVRQ